MIFKNLKTLSQKTLFFYFSFFFLFLDIVIALLFNIPFIKPVFWILVGLTFLTNGIFILLYGEDDINNKFIDIGKKIIKIGAGIFVFLIVLTIITSPLFFSKDYVNIIKVKEINSTDFIVNNPKQIRKVTRQMALIKVNKILGLKINGTEISTQFEITKGNIIKYHGKEYWIFPLTYSSVFSWFNNNNIPGYILVSATNPDAKAVFIKKSYKISTGYLWDNIKRVAYFKTLFAPFDYHFEIDEKGNPYWIVIKEYYKFYGHLLLPNEIYLINAKTGKTIHKNIKNAPKWVDKLIPEEIAKDLIEYNGKYKNGFFNAVFTQRNVVIPTQYQGKELWLIENTKNPDLMWFTGLTSPNKKDNSLISSIALDAKSLTAYKFTDMFGITDEKGAIDSIDSALGANAIKWKAVLPMPLIINKNFYWVASIVNKDTNIYQKEGAVKGDDITKTVIANNLEEIIFKLKENTNNKQIHTKNKRELILEKINKIEKELKELKKLVK